ncbi:hypothetical protein HK101_002312 [Irineochytrium annulatum]|nr:hypothetical protein HK101_002312 [Irineochytrium annulatum]
MSAPSTPKGVAELFLKTMAGEEKARSVEKEVEKADEKADEKALEAGLASSTSSTATLEDEKSKYRFCCWRRSTPPATTAVTPAEGNDEKPLPPTPRRRLCLRICLAILAFFVLTSAILIPLFIKVLIPRMISQGFSAGTGMSNTPFTLLGLQIKSIADAALPLNVTAMSNTSTDMTGANIDSFPTTGAGSLTVSMSNAGYAVPFNIPVTLSAPAVWTISLPRTFASIDGSTAAYPPLGFTPGSSRAYDETAKGWWPITVVRLSDDMSIRDGTLRINQRDVELRVPVPPGAIDGSGMQADVMAETVGAYKASGSGVFRADDDNAVGARMALFPLGVSFVKGVCGFFMTGDPASVPKVLIQARPDFKMGFLNFPAVPLSRVFDIGQLMKDAGLSPNTAPSSSSSDPSMNLTISGANTPTGDPRSFTTTVTMNLRNPCSLSLNLSSLSLRLNMSGIPVASITVPSLTLTQGARTISFDMQFAPPRGGGPQPGLVETLAGVLGSPSSSWVLGVDEVVVGSIGLASGASVARAWVQGLLDAVWVRVPFSILSGDVGAQAGVIIIKILESLTGGAL